MKMLFVSYGKRVLKNKSQMKIQQMAFMLIAIMMFFGLVGLLIVSVGLSNLKEKAKILREENALLLVSKLASSPEFSCGESYQETAGKVACIDFFKVLALKKEFQENPLKYKNFWGGVSNIEIIKIFPKPQDKKNLIECSMENRDNCDIISIFPEKSLGIATGNFVLLCRKKFDAKTFQTYDKCDIAKIFVSSK